jgi:hypothetical protein
MRRRDHQERVNRARGRLAEILSIEDASDLGVDRATRAVVNPSLSGWRGPRFLRRNATWYFSLIRNQSALPALFGYSEDDI